ncbi:UBC core domain-containing protein [Aphelenchoides besseyi]|nr:UBC core domain-containing protein [Aphelenchoides besseyi]
MDVYERILLVKSEVFMFRIPPLGVSKGHKASEWNLDAPDWTGRLRLVSIGDKLEIRLEDKNTGVLYAKAPITEANGVDFEAVTDSSRYFVIRLRNDNGQTAFVGIGFADRGDSFDLNVAVQDHFKSVKRDHELVKEDNTPKLDLGFKEGQTITVNIGGLKKVNEDIDDAKWIGYCRTNSLSPTTTELRLPSSTYRAAINHEETISTQRIDLKDMKFASVNFFFWSSFPMGGPTLNAVKRLKKDYQKLIKDPVPYAVAAPLQSDILEWHYCLIGCPDTPYDGGYYHGKLVFPADFPFRPPAIYMISPNGRFQTNTRLCLSISDFHPVGRKQIKIINPFVAGYLESIVDCFDYSHRENAQTLGSINTSTQEKKMLARRSREFNLKDPVFCSVFEELANKLRVELEEERRIQGLTENISTTQETEAPKTESSSLVANALMLTSVVLLGLVVRYVIISSSS